jgi:hypothetical protein
MSLEGYQIEFAGVIKSMAISHDVTGPDLQAFGINFFVIEDDDIYGPAKQLYEKVAGKECLIQIVAIEIKEIEDGETDS